jgi:predicted RNA polymerase sigma factor
LAQSKRLFDVTIAADFSRRLPAVHRAVYLLFSEGYHGASTQSAVRGELCHEAMRLGAVLLEHPRAATPTTYALCALMCLTAARVDVSGKLKSLVEQDRSLWDPKLVLEGLRLLELSASGTELTAYHVEATIASVHSAAQQLADTDWKAIVSLYDLLMAIEPSPVVALNRAIATRLRSASLSFAAAASIPPANSFGRRSLWRATRWSADSSNSA